jgi:hypothetical protein
LIEKEYIVDRERIRKYRIKLWRRWKIICQMGCWYGTWAWCWCTLGNVSAVWCTGKYCKWHLHVVPFPCLFSSLCLFIFNLVLQINSCNGFYCDGFKPNSYGKPTLWTEDWNGWLLFCLFSNLFVQIVSLWLACMSFGSIKRAHYRFLYCRFASWGGRVPHRPVKDNSFAVARFFQRGGSFHNYYMVNITVII